jgi:hypothetical protein
MAQRYVSRISSLYSPPDLSFRVLRMWTILIHPSLHLSLDSAQPWSMLILMIHSHLRLNLSQTLSLPLLPIFKTWNRAESHRQVDTAIMITA